MIRARIGFAVLCFSALLVDCNARMASPGEDVETESSAVVTPDNSIVATTLVNGAAVGETTGKFGVSDSGQATYSVPIWTPEGPMGVGPELMLRYDSSAVGSGPLGVGWSLSGNVISSITRCRKTIAVDGAAGPVDFSGDTYCLDGKRLIKIGPMEFRTEEDSFSKVKVITSETSPDGFIVYHKNGRVLSYGTSTASRLAGVRKQTTCINAQGSCTNASRKFISTTGTPATYAWALDRVTDRAKDVPGAVSNGIGNYISISYQQYPEQFSGRYGSDFEFQEMLISQIAYGYGASGSTPTRNVKFVYDATRADARFFFISGLPVQQKRLLKQIDVTGPNPPTASQLLRRYWLTYEDPTTAPKMVSGRSRLKTIKECDGAAVCKRPTTFTWEDGSNQFMDIVVPTRQVLNPRAPFSVADFNGDGKDDLLVRYATPPSGQTSLFAIYRSQVKTDGQTTATPIDDQSILTNPLQDFFYHIQPFDLDRDGRMDIMFPSSPGAGKSATLKGTITTFDLFRNYGSQQFYLVEDPITTVAPGNRYPAHVQPFFVDLDGDGLRDVIEPGKATASTPSGIDPLVYRRNVLSSGSPTLEARTVLELGTNKYTIQATTAAYAFGNPPDKYISVNGFETHMADIDGSGRTAFLTKDSYMANGSTTTNTSSSEMRAFYLAADGTMQTSLTTLESYEKKAGQQRYLMLDLNGDGLMDAFNLNTSSTTATVAARATEESSLGLSSISLNTGAGFKGYSGSNEALQGTKYAIPTREDAGIQVADMNQDGLPDVVLMGWVKQTPSGTIDRTSIQVMQAATGMASGPNHFIPAPAAAAPVSTSCTGTTCAPLTAAGPVTLSSDPDGAIPAQVGDFNGDGLTDIAIVPSNEGNTIKRLHFYIHQGKKADQITKIDTGLGAHTEVQYAPVSDPEVYRRARMSTVNVPGENIGWEPWEQPAECKYPFTCLNRGMWVVSRYEVTSDKLTPAVHRFKYFEGRSDALRGWLGFAERMETDDSTGRITVTTYDNLTKVGNQYPYALRPLNVGTIVADDGISDGSNNPHTFVTRNHYETVFNASSSKIFSVRLADTRTTETIRVVPPTNTPLEKLVFLEDNQYSVLQNVTTTFQHDSFDNVTYRMTQAAQGDKREVTFGRSNNTTDWLIGLTTSITDKSTTAAGEQSTRTTTYEYYPGPGLSPGTNLLLKETIEGAGANSVKSITTFARGTGRLGQVTMKTTTATSTPEDISVANGSPLSRSETIDYDLTSSGAGVYPKSIANALGQTTLFAYHPGLGVLSQTEDPNGQVTKFTYDGFGRLRSSSEPTSGDVTITHEAVPASPGTLEVLLTPLSPKFAIHTKQVGGDDSIVTYNFNGRELLRQNMAGDGQYRYILTRYTGIPGQIYNQTVPIRMTDTSAPSTFFYWDALGRQTQAMLPDGKLIKYRVSARTNDTRGRLITTTDPKGFKHEEQRDELGRIVTTTDYPGGTAASTSYQYGPFDLLKTVTPPPVVSPGGTKTAVQTMEYDVLGRRTQLIDADSGLHKTYYNAYGDIIKEVDAMGETAGTYYDRDLLGRVKKRSATEGDTVNVWDTATGKGVGKLRSSTTPDGTSITNVYDTIGRPLNTTWVIKGRSYTLAQQYETTGGTLRLRQLDYPATAGTNALSVTFGYDAVGGVSSVSKLNATTPYWKATNWSSDGRIEKENDATGMVTTRTYNPSRGWVDSIRTVSPTNVVIQGVNYGHDANGNISSRYDGDPAVNTVEGFTYNEMDQLSTWSFNNSATTWTTNYLPTPSGTFQQTKTGTGSTSLSYDYFGTAAAGMPHAAKSVNGKALTYDTKGNQTTTFGNFGVTYTSFDMPKSIANLTTGTNPFVTFAYDGDNSRVFKDIVRTTGNGHETTTYVGGFYERRVAPTGAVTHVMYVKNGKRTVAQETWTESGTTVTPAPVLYLHDDVIGSVTTTNTTATGAPTRLRYDPFGARISVTNPTIADTATPPTTLAFTEHEIDLETGLYNMKGRMFDPKIGRFLSADPLVGAPYHSHGYDRYGYVLNNPLRYTDPTGNMCTYTLDSGNWVLVGCDTGGPSGPGGPAFADKGPPGLSGTPMPSGFAGLDDGTGASHQPPDRTSRSWDNYIMMYGSQAETALLTMSAAAATVATAGLAVEAAGGAAAAAQGAQAAAAQAAQAAAALATRAAAALTQAGAAAARSPAAIRAVGGAMSGLVSGTVQGKDAQTTARGAVINAAIAALNPAASVANGALRGAINTALSNNANQALGMAMNGGKYDFASLGAAIAGRFTFGVASSGISPSDVAGRMAVDMASGVSSGLAGGASKAAQGGF